MSDTSGLANQLMKLSRILAASKKHGMTYAVWDRDISNTEEVATALTAKDKEIEALREKVSLFTKAAKHAVKISSEWKARAETAERELAQTQAHLAMRNSDLAEAERERNEARAALEELSVGHECQLHLANAALKPFSSLFDLIDDLTDSPDDTAFFQHDGTIITFGQIRAARAVIKQGEER